MSFQLPNPPATAPGLPTSGWFSGDLWTAYIQNGSAQFDGGANISSFGGGAGTVLEPMTATTWKGRIRRLYYQATAAAQAFGVYGNVANASFSIGTTTDGGGFSLYLFGGTGITFGGGAGLYAGAITVNVASLTSANVLGAGNWGYLGVVRNGGEANYRIAVKDRSGAAAVSVDTGIASAANQLFAVSVVVPQGISPLATVKFRVFNSTTGAITASVSRQVETGALLTSGDQLTWGIEAFSSAIGDQVQFVRVVCQNPDNAFVGM